MPETLVGALYYLILSQHISSDVAGCCRRHMGVTNGGKNYFIDGAKKTQ
jgi:hypothetical protein